MATIVTRETGATAVNRTLTNAELDNNFINLNSDIQTKQPLDGDLTAIAALTGSGGLLKRAGDNSWLLDYSTYATQSYVGIQIANLVSSAPATLDTLNELATALGNDANFSTTITTALGNKQPLDADLTAIAALSGTSGFLKKTAADTWTLDTNSYALSSHTHSYLSAESDTLATVTARGASTSTAVTLSSTSNHYSGHFYLDAYEAGGNHYPHFNDGSSASGVKVNWRLYTGSTNSVTHQWTVLNTDFANNVRTPIFYDLNDTSYYVDPNGGSRLLHIFAGNVASSNDGSWNARLNLVGSSHARLDVVSNSDGIITTMYSHTGQGMGKIGTYSNHPLALMAEGANTGGYVYNGSIRAPIFYDSDDTGYYLNPNASTSLRTVGDWRADSSTWTGEFSGKIQYHSNNWYFQAAGDFIWRNGGGTNVVYGDQSGNHWAISSSRAPIFYDSDNTGYYANPAGRSNFSSLQFDNSNLYLYQGDGTGLRIQTAYGWINIGAQNSSWTHVYSDKSFYTNQDWYVNGNLIHHDGNAGRARNSYLMYYQGFTLDANTMDHNATGFTYSVNAPATGPVVRFSTGGSYDLWLNAPYNSGNNLYFRTRNGDAGSINSWRALASYGINYGGSLYATILYDSDNTGYYVDPNSTSRMARIDPDEIYNYGWFRNHNNLYGLYNQANGTHFYSNGAASWAITGSGGTVELQFRSNHQTTVRGYIYGNTSSDFGFLDSSGNWRVRTNSGYQELYATTYTDTQYGYIWYDRNDTAYYLDPNSTSRIATVAITGNTYLQNSSPTLYFQDSDNRSAMIHVNSNYWYILRGNGTNSTSWEQYDGYWPLQIYLENNSAEFGGQIKKRGINVPALWVQDSAPSPYNYGDMWWESDTGKLKIYYYDGNTAQWVDAVPIPDTSTFFSKAGGGITGPVVMSSSLSVAGSLIAEGPLTMATATGSTGSINRAFVIKEAGDATIDMGAYPGSWTSALQIQSNDASTYLWLSPLTSNIPRLQTNYGSFDIHPNGSGSLAARFYSGSTRSSMFYDVDDTTYYVDPNSYSFVSSLRANGYLASNGNIYTDSNYGYGLVGTYAASRYQGVYAMSDSYKLAADGSTTGNLYGIAWSHPNAGGVAANLNTHGMLIMENGGFLAAVSGSIRARDNMHAPIYYDRDDTGYYCDPASSSRFNQTRASYYNVYAGVGNGIRFWESDAYKISMGDSSLYIYGPVTGYSIKTNMDNGSTGRGFTWGREGYAPIAAIESTYGNMQIAGSFTAGGNVTAYSDISLKDNIENITDAVSKIMKVRGVTFTRNDLDDKTKRYAGVIAQEVEAVLPEVVEEDINGIKHVAYGNMIGLLLEAIKEQQSEIDELKALVKQLLAR